MLLQYIAVGTIVFSAFLVASVRFVRFFKTPASKCHGCSGCKLEELKKV